MSAKPRIRLAAVATVQPASRLEIARQRFGRPFAHEPGTRWKPRATPVLTEWMQQRGRA